MEFIVSVINNLVVIWHGISERTSKISYDFLVTRFTLIIMTRKSLLDQSVLVLKNAHKIVMIDSC